MNQSIKPALYRCAMYGTNTLLLGKIYFQQVQLKIEKLI